MEPSAVSEPYVRPNRLSWSPAAAVCAFTIASVWSLARVNDALTHFFRLSADNNVAVNAIPVLGSLLLATLFIRTRYAHFVPIARLALRASALGLLVDMLVEPPDFTLANQAAAGAAQYITFFYVPCLLIGLLSLFRPSFVATLVVYIFSARVLAGPISTVGSSTLDIAFMLDMALYLCAFGIISLHADKFLGRVGLSGHRTMIQETITYVSFGLHLSNYFWSGTAKLLIGPYPWTWIVENKTYNGLLFSIQNGTSPIGSEPWLVQIVYDVFSFLVMPMNFFIVAFQLLAIVCVFRLSWLRVTTTFYDLLHIGIYILGGLFFWQWIWNNFTILIAATKERAGPSVYAKGACVLVILLGYPPLPFQRAAWLAWFDVADARQIYFEAVGPNGPVKVPSSFFLGHSYGVSHGYMDTVPHTGQYPHLRWWASAKDYSRLLSSGSCPAPGPVDPSTLETPEARQARLERIQRFISAHHAKMLSRQDRFGLGSYYWRAHHHPSNPLLFSAFNNLDLHTVKSYNLIVESVCHSIENGHVRAHVVGRLQETFNVNQ